ncbi:MAG: hypothetical protein IT378_07180 [Sandaracinaceae bacterium]|nr:hypothetical protein [Sandaracinaceae bacterium]
MRAIAAILLLAVCARAGAQERVEIRFAGDEESQLFLRPPIDELLAPVVSLVVLERVDVLDLRTVVDPPADPAPALARVWVERGTDRVTIFLVDRDWERILIRHVPVPEALDEAAREQVAQIVHAAIEALLGGARLGVTREEARQSLDVPRAVEPPAAPVAGPASRGLLATGDLSLAYAGQLFADGPALRHAITVAIALRFGEGLGGGALRPVVLVAGELWPSLGADGQGLHLELRSWVLRAEGGVDVEPAAGTTVRVTAGLALDVTNVEPRTLAAGGALAGSAYDAVAPLVSLRAAVLQRVWEWLGVSAGLALDLDLLDTRYVVATPAGDRSLLDPWPLRLALVAGACVLWR